MGLGLDLEKISKAVFFFRFKLKGHRLICRPFNPVGWTLLPFQTGIFHVIWESEGINLIEFSTNPAQKMCVLFSSLMRHGVAEASFPSLAEEQREIDMRKTNARMWERICD